MKKPAILFSLGHQQIDGISQKNTTHPKVMHFICFVEIILESLPPSERIYNAV